MSLQDGALYSASVTKDHLVFSAAHFITFNGNICERLHGHNWRVNVEVTGQLDENYYVYDFIALRDKTQKLVNLLDHHMLLAEFHPAICITQHPTEVEVTFESRRWIFPIEDCVILPVENTTAERIAWWISCELIGSLFPANSANPALSRLTQLKVQVEENFGQWATCTRTFQD
jgi:6-pyruvoyltetrahydropterin/6-carboxytetrahydropterin synthase